jgi:hypothetical protein
MCGQLRARSEHLLRHEPRELRRRRRLWLAGRVHDRRRERIAGVFQQHVHLHLQRELHELQRHVSEPFEQQQQLRFVRARMHEQPRVHERELPVQLVVVSELPDSEQQVLQEQHDVRVRASGARLQLVS